MSFAANQHFPNPPGVNPNDDAAGQLIGWGAGMAALSGVAVLLRFLARSLVRQGKRTFHAEDWLSLAALPFAWMMCFVAIWGAVHDNFGHHLGSSTPASLHRFLIGLWVFEQAYNFAITLAKLSIIALWWRIFDVKSCHICLIVVGVLEILWLIASTLTLVFSCIPVNGFWDLDISSQCIQQSHYWIGAAVPNISFDIILLILPNFWIMKLSISRGQKFALALIFTLGIFVTVCSSLRLWQLIIYNAEDSEDLPWVMVGTAIWSLVEGNLSVLCCCLPSMRPLLRLLTHGHANYGYDYTRNRGAAPTPLNFANAHPEWGIGPGGAVIPLKHMPSSKVLESPTSPVDAHADNWPLTPQASQTFTTAVFPGAKPDAAPHRPRVASFSTRAPSRQNETPQGPDPATWLNLNETSNDGGTPMAVSEAHDQADANHSQYTAVNNIRHTRSNNTSVSTDGLHRQLSVTSVGAARSPKF